MSTLTRCLIVLIPAALGCDATAPADSPSNQAGGVMSAASVEQLDEIVAALKNPNPAIRTRAAGALGHLGPEASAATPQLISLLSDHALEVRQAAAFSLGRIGTNAAAALPRLRQVQQDPAMQAVVAAAIQEIERSETEGQP